MMERRRRLCSRRMFCFLCSYFFIFIFIFIYPCTIKKNLDIAAAAGSGGCTAAIENDNSGDEKENKHEELFEAVTGSGAKKYFGVT